MTRPEAPSTKAGASPPLLGAAENELRQRDIGDRHIRIGAAEDHAFLQGGCIIAGMKLSGKVIVVTGGAHGIGRALCKRFATEGAKGVVVADRDGAGAETVAREIGGLAVRTDVSKEADILALVQKAREAYGPVDVFVSNAGIAADGGAEVPDAQWQKIWEVNVMAHVWATRAVLPSMIERGSGYLLNTASAAGLLSSVGTAPYAVTKHAAVALAEWLALTHGDQGIRVSVLCPMGVNTNMMALADHRATGAEHPRVGRGHRSGRRGRGHRARHGRGALPHPPPPRGGRLPPGQGGGLRQVGGRHAQDERQGQRRAGGEEEGRLKPGHTGAPAGPASMRLRVRDPGRAPA